MNMDRKSLVAILLCVLFYAGYEYYLNQKYPDRFKQNIVEQNTSQTSSEPGSATSIQGTHISSDPTLADQSDTDIQRLSPEELTVDTGLVTYRFDQRTGGLSSVILKEYQNEDKSEMMEILPKPLLIQGTTGNERPVVPGLMKGTRDQNKLSFSYQRGYWQITQTYDFKPDSYGADISVSWKNTASAPIELNSSVLMSENIPFVKKSGGFLPGMPTGRPSLVTSVAGKTEWIDAQKYCDDTDQADLISQSMQDLSFVGFDKHYFLQVLLPQSKKSSLSVSRTERNKDIGCTITHWMSLNQGSVAPGESVHMTYKAWFGPKSTEIMEAYDPLLKESLDLGMFSAISRPLFLALKYIQTLVGNWGLTIIIFTILLKILFYPLTRQAAVAQNKMKKLQPQMNKIKEKYKDDPRRQQQEIMQFMSSNKVNPMKGCFPILPQIPVFIAFYRVLSTSIELRQAPFFLWIHDLSVQDPYFITPVLLGVTMLIQQKLMPTTGMDKTQERIMMMLPLVFTIMMLTLPAGMVLYMLANTLMSIGQQQWLNRKLG